MRLLLDDLAIRRSNDQMCDLATSRLAFVDRWLRQVPGLVTLDE